MKFILFALLTLSVSFPSFAAEDFSLIDDWVSNHPRNRPMPFLVTYYSLNIDAEPESGLIRGVSNLFISSLYTHLESITVDAYDMDILSVKVENEIAKYHYNGETVLIFFKKALAFHEHAEVNIQYEAKRSQSFYHPGPDIMNPHRMQTAYTYTQPEDSRKWFPCIDRPMAKAPFEMQVSVPKPYKALSNGELISQTETQNRTHFHYKMQNPMSPYLVSLAIGHYEVISIGDYEGKPLTLWTPPDLKEKAKYDTSQTAKMIEVFSRFTGLSYPYASYTQAITPAWEVSMEHQTASSLGSWVITGDRMDEATIAHELAHQWFGNWVTPETWVDLWLSEGFASFLPYIFYIDIKKNNKALGEIDDWRTNYFNEVKKGAHALSPLNPDVDSMFDAHAYEKGALVIKMMRYLANLTPSSNGEENFRKAVHQYLTEHGEKTVRHTDLQNSLERVTGHSWQTFFDQWVRSSGHPRLEVEFDNIGDELVLKIHQAQSTDPKLLWPAFQFPIPIDVYAEDGRRERHIIELYDSLQEIRIRPGFEVEDVDFDPEWDVPVEVDFRENVDTWLKIFKHSPFETSRIHAMRMYLSHRPIANTNLLDLILKDSSLFLKSDALRVLSLKNENYHAIEEILKNLETRSSEWDRIIRNAVAAGHAWLMKTQPSTFSVIDEQKLQEQYMNSSLTVEERKAILDKLSVFSLTRAQSFALDRLKESKWSMRDRVNILHLLCLNPTDVSLNFIKEFLQSTSSLVWFRFFSSDLKTSKYDRHEIVPLLLQRAKHDFLLGIRIYAIELLAFQNSSQKEICPELKTLSNLHEIKPDRLDEVRLAAKKAMEALKCM